MAKTYRKTATIQSTKFTGDNLEEIKQDSDFEGIIIFVQFKVVGSDHFLTHEELLRIENTAKIETHYFIKTLEGDMEFTPGCWIASGGAGDFWAIQPDRFTETYEEVQ